MKYFKLINGNGWVSFKEGWVYRGDYIAKGKMCSVIEHAESYPNDWQQVTKPKKSLSERIEKLQKQAKKEGFELQVVYGPEKTKQLWDDIHQMADNIRNMEPILESKANFLKDEWEGVEYVEYIGSPWPNGQKIFKVISIDDRITVVDGTVENGHLLKRNCKASTESAYVDQLKAKAKEFYGEIKGGDKFDLSGQIGFVCHRDPSFCYEKDMDCLFFGLTKIYEQGKWATKLPKRIEVKSIVCAPVHGMLGVEGKAHMFSFEISEDIRIGYEHHYFLTKQLESYLNGETG